MYTRWKCLIHQFSNVKYTSISFSRGVEYSVCDQLAIFIVITNFLFPVESSGKYFITKTLFEELPQLKTRHFGTSDYSMYTFHFIEVLWKLNIQR